MKWQQDERSNRMKPQRLKNREARRAKIPAIETETSIENQQNVRLDLAKSQEHRVGVH